jgi:hypothetical protein
LLAAGFWRVAAIIMLVFPPIDVSRCCRGPAIR